MVFDIKKFSKLTTLSAERAADALTKLTGLETKINILNIHIEKMTYEFKNLSSDSYVTTIQLPIRGDVTGSILLLFPKEVSMKLSSVLTKTDRSSQYGFDEMEVSALKEVGNIMCGSFLTVISNELKISIVEHLPIFMFDTLSTVMHSLYVQNQERDEDALLVEVRFQFDKTDISGFVVLAFGIKEMKIIEKALEKFNA